jgi:hypothetical protein
MGWYSISPDGAKLVVKYQSTDSGCGGAGQPACCEEATRVYDINASTLALTVRSYAHNPRPTACLGSDSDDVCGAPSNGYVMPVGHADMAANTYDSGEVYSFGQTNSCSIHGATNVHTLQGSSACTTPESGNDCEKIGRVLGVRLSDGKVSNLMDHTLAGAAAAASFHVSARSVAARPGWVLVSFKGTSADVGKRFYDEIAAIRMRGPGSSSTACERWAHQHSNRVVYEDEPHPSADGISGLTAVWGSNWDLPTAQNPSGVVGAYVVDTRSLTRP